MTVEELREHLKAYEGNRQVCFPDYANNVYLPVQAIRKDVVSAQVFRTGFKPGEVVDIIVLQ